MLDAFLLRTEADISPEIQLRIITNKIKKDEAEGTSKKKKDQTNHDENSPIMESEKLREKIDEQEYSLKNNNKCDVAEGTCQFAEVKAFVVFLNIFVFVFVFLS